MMKRKSRGGGTEESGEAATRKKTVAEREKESRIDPDISSNFGDDLIRDDEAFEVLPTAASKPQKLALASPE